ncbi:hypothetical protein [Variovorax terrae]|uniref:Uncharacterized protein n=1 Tax=Variovorax terrae TaxID=2923278 RepID=A0A9X1VWG9_9BURK|nr:hypothetical protein [Variovorax terrae]MCJ0764515.1 hypothetical protein [Variovorax terrae]MCJ0764523.1 hypothetical protein [Variovorax terrae]
MKDLKTRDEIRALLRDAVIADPASIGRAGELGAIEIHPHPTMLHEVDGLSWTWSCTGASPAILAALGRHAPGLQARLDLRG